MTDEQATIQQPQETVEQADATETQVASASLEDQLAEAQALAAEYLDGWQRARAELANYRRRTELQRAEMVYNANADLLTQLLPVLDDLQLALANSPTADSGPVAWQEWGDGTALIARKFANILEGVGLAPFETEGQTFDPNLHEAISYEEAPSFESGQIIATVRQGYKLGDRVLRPAMVRVAR